MREPSCTGVFGHSLFDRPMDDDGPKPAFQVDGELDPTAGMCFHQFCPIPSRLCPVLATDLSHTLFLLVLSTNLALLDR